MLKTGDDKMVEENEIDVFAKMELWKLLRDFYSVLTEEQIKQVHHPSVPEQAEILQNSTVRNSRDALYLVMRRRAINAGVLGDDGQPVTFVPKN